MVVEGDVDGQSEWNKLVFLVARTDLEILCDASHNSFDRQKMTV